MPLLKAFVKPAHADDDSQMRDEVRRVIEAEEDARKRVEAARAEKERILAAASREAAALIENSRSEIRDEARHLLQAAEQTALRKKSERLAAMRSKIEQEITIDDSTRESVVAAGIRCICGESDSEIECS